jgi:hypothetical protein
MNKYLFIIFFVFGIGIQSYSQNQTYIHPFSKTKFKGKVGNFISVGPRTYDASGKDISVGYNSFHNIALTQYIYPSNDEDLNQHFENYKTSLLSNKSNPKLLSEADVTTKKILGKFAKFEFYEDFFGVPQLVYSYLYIYKSKGWFIMLRITCKTNFNAVFEKEITDYVDKMPFPNTENK